MEELYKKRTYIISIAKEPLHKVNIFTASWNGYSAEAYTKNEALEKCHQMIEDDLESESFE